MYTQIWHENRARFLAAAFVTQIRVAEAPSWPARRRCHSAERAVFGAPTPKVIGSSPTVEGATGRAGPTFDRGPPQTARWSPQSDLHTAHQEGGFFRTPRPPPHDKAALPCGGRSGVAFRTRPERCLRSDHGASAPVRPQDPPTRILANSGILLFSCVPMFESLLKLHPRDPSLVRLNARGIARLLVRLLPRELHKPSRCTGKPNCQCPPPWATSSRRLDR